MSAERPRLLIVEDESPLRTALERYFVAQGLDVLGIGDAESALDLLARETVDAVLLDNCLPGMMGITALPRLRRLSGAPVILMTGHATEETARDARALGADGFVGKPLDLPALVSRLRALVAPRA